MDDGYAIGAPSIVFDAVRHFGAAVEAIGTELQEDKCEWYCPAGPESTAALRLSTFPLGRLLLKP